MDATAIVMQFYYYRLCSPFIGIVSFLSRVPVMAGSDGSCDLQALQIHDMACECHVVSMLSLQVLLATEDVSCLRKFLSLHGLKLLWSWMIDSADLSSSEVLHLRIHVSCSCDCHVTCAWLTYDVMITCMLRHVTVTCLDAADAGVPACVQQEPAG